MNQILEVIDRFFLDIIGTIVPGAALICGLWILFDSPGLPDQLYLLPPEDDLFNWLLLVLASYVVGYAVSSVGENVIVRILDRRPFRSIGSKLFPRSVVAESELLKNISESAEYQAFVGLAANIYSVAQTDSAGTGNVRIWRNIALSVVQEHNYLVHRFMFISLFNLGMATVILLLAFLWIWIWLIGKWCDPEVSVTTDFWPLILVLSTVPFLLERRYSFYNRAMRVPFSMAVVRLRRSENGG